MKKKDWQKISQDFLAVWTAALGSAIALVRHEPMENMQYVLYADWSKEGMGFVLCGGDHMIWMGSKANSFWSRHVSSFLEELKAIVWALHECMWILRESDVAFRTDFDSS